MAPEDSDRRTVGGVAHRLGASRHVAEGDLIASICPNNPGRKHAGEQERWAYIRQ